MKVYTINYYNDDYDTHLLDKVFIDKEKAEKYLNALLDGEEGYSDRRAPYVLEELEAQDDKQIQTDYWIEIDITKEYNSLDIRVEYEQAKEVLLEGESSSVRNYHSLFEDKREDRAYLNITRKLDRRLTEAEIFEVIYPHVENLFLHLTPILTSGRYYNVKEANEFLNEHIEKYFPITQ